MGNIKRSFVNCVGLEKTATKTGDRLSKKDEKLSYLHKIHKKKFLVIDKKWDSV